MKEYQASQEFSNTDLELGLAAAVAAQPDLYLTISDIVSEEAFSVNRELWKQIGQAIETETALPAVIRRVNKDGAMVEELVEPVSEPEAVASNLADLYCRRFIADLSQTNLQRLRSGESPEALINNMEAKLAEISQSMTKASLVSLQWAKDLVSEVIAEAEAAARRRQETGSTISGLSTGIRKLDDILNGLNPGVHILAGPPGSGKTTLALQITSDVNRTYPGVYVTFENKAKNLVLKSVCRLGKISPSDVQRGIADLDKLREGTVLFQDISPRLAFMEGNSRLTLAMIRGKCLESMHRHGSEKCLLVIDFLQRMALSMGYQNLRENVGELILRLRELSNRLDLPILAISSLNRQGYQQGQSNAFLETLKESGDIEYSADSVLFLQEDKTESAVQSGVRNMHLKVVKNRYGEAGGDIPVTFKASIGEFRETARNDPSQR